MRHKPQGLTRWLISVGLGACLSTGLSASFASAVAADSDAPLRRVNLVFTNDFESAYDPIEAFWRDDIERIGGIAHLATLVDVVRDTEDTVFLFDAGDIFTGSLARRSKGAIAFDLMQLMRYDAMAIGNHEFEYGWEVFADEKDRAPFPVLGANLKYKDSRYPYAQGWTIIERDGVRVGVIGLMGQDAATALIPSHIAGVDVLPPEQVLRALVPRLRPEVDVVVVLVHQGPTAPMQTDDEADPSVYRGNLENITLAGAVPGVDVIFAGHTDAGTESALIHPETGTLIMQTWGQGQHLGSLQLDLDAQGHIVAHHSRLIPVDALRYPAHPVVSARLAHWRSAHPDLVEPVGVTGGPVVRRYYTESPLGNLYADVARAATGSVVGLMPSGGLRRDLPAGVISREVLIDSFPFQDRLARVNLRGALLLDVLEQGFSLERGLLQVSGIEVAYDPDAPVGQRVRAVCVGDQALDPEQVYAVGTIEIIARGGDAYTQFNDADQVELLGQSFYQALEAHFATQGNIASPSTGRLHGSGSTALSCTART